MKKKLWTGILAAALIFSLGTVNVLARGPHCSARHGHHNADGICAYYTDENCDGVCDTCGAAHVQRNGFTDANNDGICDYYDTAPCGGGHCGGHGGCRR